ncbi:MAG: BRO-N domain-containing protein [Candidatus Nanoarchaeia archaeon]
MDEDNALVVFQGKNIRKTWHNDEWWFSVVDIIEVLTGSERPRKYWADLKFKLLEEGSEPSDFIGQLKLPSKDGKYYETDCVNTEGAFRIVQSIPSPKAEPFKLWLAKVGYERVQEIENPELAQKRMKELYVAKGYSEEWIEKRVRGINVRDSLTEEWKKRGVQKQNEFAILTAEISKATFDMTPSEYKEFKGLKRENLRDHMDDLELIFSMLGEASTTEIEKVRNPSSFPEHKEVSKEGGSVAGSARKDLESKTKKRVATSDSYLKEPEKEKRKKVFKSSLRSEFVNNRNDLENHGKFREYKDVEELKNSISKESIVAIEKARKRMKEGNFLTEEEVKKRLGL